MREVLDPGRGLATARRGGDRSAGEPSRRRRPSRGCAKASLNLVEDGQLTIGTDNPAYPAVVRRRREDEAVEDQRPEQGQGLRVGGRLRSREAARLHARARSSGSTRRSTRRSRRAARRSTSTSTRSRTRPSAPRCSTFSASYYNVNQSVVGAEGQADLARALASGPEAATSSARSSARRATSTSSNRIKPTQQPSVYDTNDARGRGAEERADRRARGRPADGVLRHRGAGAELEGHRPVPLAAGRRALRHGLPEGQLARRLRQPGARQLKRTGALAKIQQTWLAKVTSAPVLSSASRSSRILGGGGAGRAVTLALLSTVVLFVALGYLVTHSPGWPEVKAAFFDWDAYRDSFPEIARAFLLNVKIFLIAEAFILVFALAARRAARPARAGVLPGAAAGGRLRRLLPRRADDPRHRAARLRRAGARAGGRSRPRRRSGASSRSSSSTRPTSPRSTAPASSRCTRARRRPRARSA